MTHAENFFPPPAVGPVVPTVGSVAYREAAKVGDALVDTILADGFRLNLLQRVAVVENAPLSSTVRP